MVWKVYLADDGAEHVVPSHDLRDHLLSQGCWCKPGVDEGIVVHNSMDRREEIERGGKMS